MSSDICKPRTWPLARDFHLNRPVSISVSMNQSHSFEHIYFEKQVWTWALVIASKYIELARRVIKVMRKVFYFSNFSLASPLMPLECLQIQNLEHVTCPWTFIEAIILYCFSWHVMLLFPWLVMRPTKHKYLALVSKNAAMRDIFQRFSSGQDSLPSGILNIISHRSQVYPPHTALQTILEILTAQNVKVRPIRTVTHIASTLWHLTFQTDGDPRLAHKVSRFRITRALQFLPLNRKVLLT